MNEGMQLRIPFREDTDAEYCHYRPRNGESIQAVSPLRYPGGKTRAVKLITRLFPSGISRLCSPFFGGGSIELKCASKGILVFGYDIFQPLVDFWSVLLDRPEELAEAVEREFPLPKDRFYHFQKIQSQLPTKLERAAVFYILNRSSYSGSTLSGGMSPGHPRFTKTSIDRIRHFFNPNIRVEHADFRESIARHADSFLYLDPPYLIDNHLYGKNGDTHKNFSHEDLRDTLKGRDSWILSYNNCDTILKWYSEYEILFPDWKYGMSKNKESREVIILSHDVRDRLTI